MSKIENYKYSIEDAFTECFYIVPDYQREYVWTDKEINQLLDDINDDINGSSKEYFIGTILVSPTENKKHYEVIDGQQRLTTFFLILCALKHLFSGEPQSQLINGLISASYTNDSGDVITALKLDPRYENASELMTKLVHTASDPVSTKAAISASGIPSFGSLENLVTAYDTVYRYLKDNYVDKTSLKKYWAYLVLQTVRMAQEKEAVAAELQLHSDQGFQYTSQAYFALTRDYGITPSMSRRGNCYDNAMAENFFGILKSECLRRHKPLSIAHARQLIDNFIFFYNHERIQLKTKLTPLEKRRQFI